MQSTGGPHWKLGSRLGSPEADSPAVSKPKQDQARLARARDDHTLATIAGVTCAEPGGAGLYLRERYLSHRVLDDYEAVLEAVCRAWNRLLDEIGRLTTLTAYPYLTASGIP